MVMRIETKDTQERLGRKFKKGAQMTKTKWYAKPLYIVMALLLVLSFSLVTAVPAMATGSAAIDPIAADYDLYTPGDINTTITWNNATSVVSVNDDVGALATPADYEVVSDNLTIRNADLAAKLPVVGNSVALTINFDVGDPATFNITAIWTGPATYPVTLLQTTDIHSHASGVVPFESYTPMTPGNGSVITGGFARLATVINETRDAKTANGSAVLLVDSADWSMGTVYDFLWNTDPPYLKFLQAMKYDVTTLGNHEWDYGPDKLATMITAAQNASGFNVPIVASNTFFDNVTGLLALQANGSIVTTYVKTLPNGLKIGFIGLIGAGAVDDAPNAPPVTFKPDWAGADKAYIQGIVDDLRNNQTVNVVIALSHSGIDPTTVPVSGDDIELAKNINGIDIIASGHLHIMTPVIIDQANINTPNPTNITHIICAGSYTTNLAQLDFTATANGVTDLVLTNHPINDSIPGDSAINAMVLDMDTEIDTLIAPLGIGIADVEATMGNFSLEGAYSGSSSGGENGLGNLIADSLRYAGTEPSNFTIGAFATGMIRDPLIANQNVTFADLFRVVPLGITRAEDQNNSYPGYPELKIYLNGTEIWDVCRFNGIIAATGLYTDAFIHLSGIQYSYHYAAFPQIAVVDSVKAYAWNDYNCTGTPTEDVDQDTALYPVIIDSYVIDMLLSPSIQDLLSLFGISIQPKFANGTRVNASNMLTARLDKDAETGGVQEEHAWSALLDYLTDPIANGGLSGAIPADPYDLLTTSHKRIIVSGEAVSFVFDTIADQKTRVPFEITITAHDAEGIVAASYTGKANLIDLTGTISPTTTDNFAKGVWTGEVTITKAYTDNTITASHSEITGSSNDFDVYYTPTDYALSGMPDFDQKQDNWTDNGTATGNWTYCGPVAVANSLWLFDSKNEPSPVPPPTINDHYGLVTNFSHPWDDHDPQNAIPLVNDLAALMNTGPNGTDVMDMQAGIDQYLNNTGYAADYNETTVLRPDFDWIEEEVERGEDVVLLLGFWQWNGTWWRVGGHYVTVAGVNSNTSQLSISDPYFDSVGNATPGMHNDTQYVSHDIYNVTWDPCPAGNWSLANYTDGKEGYLYNFQGQNSGPGLIPPGAHNQELPVMAIIDYAVVVSPITATLEGQVSFTGRGSNNTQWIEEFVVWFFDNGTKAEMAWSPINTTTDTTGFFTITGLTLGTYDIGIKGGAGLSELETNVTLTPDNTTVVDFGTMRVGDANNDDYTTISDRTLLYGGWGTEEGVDPGFRPYCDFNNDGYLTISDRTLLYGNWGQQGDLAP
jgi:5'-nucleotidase/UDP-sugar diphosphatase